MKSGATTYFSARIRAVFTMKCGTTELDAGVTLMLRAIP